jgi:dimethylhistidine N-methyltransferase
MATAVEQLALPAQSLAQVVRDGLTRTPKQLPPWLFYDEAGSLLFERITTLPEYYLTRIERALLATHAPQMIAAAGEGQHLCLIELGAGSADKTRTLLAATLAQQPTVEYRPVDVSLTALEAACRRIRAELPLVTTSPLLADYAVEWAAPDAPPENTDRKLLLWIGSSIGNFEPHAATALLKRISRTMAAGDCLLLGVDLAPRSGGKSVEELLAAYDDPAGVTAEFNRNILVRLNRELGANFVPEAFTHRALWNPAESRIEMHLESTSAQAVRLEALGLTVSFQSGERLHTENSYKYSVEQATTLMANAGFPAVAHWTDPESWFAVLLGRRV